MLNVQVVLKALHCLLYDINYLKNQINTIL